MPLRPSARARCAPTRRAGRAITLVVAALVVLLLVPLVGARDAGAADAPGWRRPVPGAVTRGFEPPAGPYAPGHRGIDLAAAPGAPVVAVGPGEVVFAGAVVGGLHVVVRHDNGWRTSYSALGSITVRAGARVRVGDPIGTCCGPLGPDDAHAGAIHLGLRIGDDYVDPQVLWVPADLAAVVHLAPAHGREWPSERRGALEMILDVTGASTAIGWGRDALGLTRGALDTLGSVLSAGADRLPELLRYLDEMESSPLGPGLLGDLAQGVWSWVDQRDECDPDPPTPGSVAQSNELLFVAGIESRTRRDGSTNGIDPVALGYAAEDVHWYSYAPGGGAYTPDDTHAAIDDSARRLGAQLRALQRAQPGRSVDLIAHSQGGVVVQTFLKLHYDPADPTLPPIGTVVTLSSPHAGAPLATSGVALARSAWGRALLASIDGVPSPTAPSVRDLDERGELLRRLRDRELPPGLEMVSIGAPFDLVVPQTATRLDGARSMTADPASDPLHAHSAVTTDAATRVVINNALLGRAAPCVTLTTALASAAVPERVALVERVPGVLASMLSG